MDRSLQTSNFDFILHFLFIALGRRLPLPLPQTLAPELPWTLDKGQLVTLLTSYNGLMAHNTMVL